MLPRRHIAFIVIFIVAFTLATTPAVRFRSVSVLGLTVLTMA